MRQFTLFSSAILALTPCGPSKEEESRETSYISVLLFSFLKPPDLSLCTTITTPPGERIMNQRLVNLS
jgi:hypothetical protein